MDLFIKLFGDLLTFVYHCFDRIVIHGYLQLQTGYPPDRGIRLSFLDDGHDTFALPQWQPASSP
jgi:hypothetical protein